MTTIPVYTPAGEKAGEVELAVEVFGVEPNAALLHQAVVTTLANLRQGTADTKTRGEVHHTTKKLFRQKGTGRARQGMRSAPHWKGGGIAFGPHPRDYTLNFPKKMRRAALVSALSAKAPADGLRVVDNYGIDKPSTKSAAAILSALRMTDKKVLVVLDDPTAEVVLSFQNLPKVLITTVEMVGTYDILAADYLLMTRAAIETLQQLKREPVGIARWMANQQGGVA